MKRETFEPADVLQGLPNQPSYMDFPLAGTKHPVVVIAPGGGWKEVAVGREGVNVARWLNTLGIAARVVRYRTPRPGMRYPTPMNDLRWAIQEVREDAAKTGTDPGRIGIIGFSAGGHIAGCLAMLPEGNWPGSRPNFAILVSAVVNESVVFCRDRLFGADGRKEDIAPTNLQTQVSLETPPMFFAHAEDDKMVPISGVKSLYDNLRSLGRDQDGASFIEEGGHGLGGPFGLPPSRDDAQWPQWPDKCEEWLRKIGILPTSSQKST